ncbi:MAG TPA: hypothetical protein VHO90_16525 [Bacteroidales bacterium]|nr:hypothetical protein [Bacteroidales bacterium]
MKRVILGLLLICAVSALQAKTWTIIGKALEEDTSLMEQDVTNTSVYKYVGKISTGKFKLSDGTNVYVPGCGLNDPMGQQIGMEVQADISQTGFGVKYVNPTKTYIITVTDGVKPTVKVEMAETYAHVYLIGGPVSTNPTKWELRDAVELEQDKTNQFVFYYRGFLMYNSTGEEPGSIKFLTSNTSWGNGFHPTGDVNVALTDASRMRLNGSDTKWELPADGSANGYYVIRLNTLNETIEIIQFTPKSVAFPNKVYITGDAMPCGWVADFPETMTTTNLLEGKYQWTGNVVPGKFKFLKSKGSWGSCYVSTFEDQTVQYNINYPVVYEFEYYNNGGKDYKFVFNQAVKCTISLDLSAMKVLVQKATTTPVEVINKQTTQYNIRGHNETIRASSSDTLPKEISVFNYVGQKVYSNNFVSNTEFSIRKGFYIVVITDTQKQVCKKVKLML